MRKIILFVLITFIHLTNTLYSQTEIPKAITRKNEIALDIKPVLISTLGATNEYSNTTGLMYKHHFGKSALRLGLTPMWSKYTKRLLLENYDFNSQIHFPSNTKIETDTSSSTLWGTIIGKSRYSFSFDLGFEYNFGKRKLTHFIGTDFNLGFFSVLSQISRTDYAKDTSYTPDQLTFVRYTLVSESQSMIKKIGISPFYGVKYSISKRFSLAMQTGIEYYFLTGDIKYSDDIGNQYENNINTRGLHISGLIGDFSVIYHF